MRKYSLEAVFHEPNSRFAYAYDKDTLHIRLQTKKDEIGKVDLVWNDTFNWRETVEDDGTTSYGWHHQLSPMKLEFQTKYSDHWFIELKCPTKRYKYAFLFDNEVMVGQNDIIDFEDIKSNPIHNYYNFPYTNEADIPQKPDWLKGMVWYQIFVDRFYTNNPKLVWDVDEVDNKMIFGGNLQGIVDKLDYLEDLGINGIYLNPIFESPSAHKYDTTDYYKVDPSFGTNNDLKILVDEAHSRGMKIMLDGVFNHCGFLHPYWQDVLKNEEKSKYYEYFTIREKPIIDFELKNGQPYNLKKIPNYETFAFVANMPKWNTNKQIVRDYLKDIAIHYVKEYNIDAWRWDVSEEPSHKLWIEITEEISKIKPNFYHVGENWYDSNAWFTNNQFNSVMNYPMQFAILEFLQDEIDEVKFIERINKVLWMYPKNIIENLYNLLDCHDTPRVKTVLGNNTELAYVLMFTFPGVPSIYYGSEIGMLGKNDPYCRIPMKWKNINNDLSSLIKKLINLRKEPAALAVDINWIDSEEALIYQKGKNNEMTVIISKYKKEIIVPEELQGKYINYITKEEILLSNNITLNSKFLILFKK